MPANSLIMVRPASFGSNPETLSDNVFQKASEIEGKVSIKAKEEFDEMVLKLRSENIEVLVLEDPGNPETTDAVFPNNWFTTHEDGELILYPMMSKMRRLERRSEFIQRFQTDFQVSQLIDLSANEEEGIFLEGTGSMVLDHENKIAYMCRSERSSEELLDTVCNTLGYTPFAFNAIVDNKPVYHTNVIMGMGDQFVVACTEAMVDSEYFEKQVASTEKELIKISISQVKSFMGNCIQVRSTDGKDYLVLSKSALGSLEKNQIDRLNEYVNLLPISTPTIEAYGGGSVRCMIAENYLTKKEQTVNA